MIPKIDILQMMEQRKNKNFVINLIFWTFLLMSMEAIDITGAAYVSPLLIKEWNVDPKLFGPAFSAGLVGIMIGSVIFGTLGDRIGRKKSLIISTIWFSIFTLACSLAESLTSFISLRLLTGLGLGGAVPLAIVLVNEYAPRRSRGKWVAIMFTGFPIGSAVGGLIAAWMIPIFGWQSIFILGGIFPLLVAIGLYFKLPESLKFLVLKNHSHQEIRQLVSKIRPDLAIDLDTQFFIREDEPRAAFSLKLLFVGSLLFITPLLWLFSMIHSSAIYFLSSWLPQVFMSSGLSLEQASIATSVYHFAGLLCGITGGCLFDKRGILACTIFPVVGSLFCALLGNVNSGPLMYITVFAVGFFVIGTQNILTIMTPTLYPTYYRSKAIGIAMAIAKIGSIAGPVIGGMLLSAKLSIQHVFLINSGIIAVGAIHLFVIGFLVNRNSMKRESMSVDSIQITN